MKRTLALALLLMAAPASAQTELIVTAGGGLTGDVAVQGCLLDQGPPTSCPANQKEGTLLVGAGIARVSDIGVRGSLKLEGAMSFGKVEWGRAQILGAAGWQGHWVIAEGGLGTALLLGNRGSGAILGGVLHAGLGLRVLRPLTLMARADLAISDTHRPYFLGLALEWLPFRGLREGP